MSLGANHADVLRMILRQAILQALAGTIVGVTGALLLSKLMAGMLFAVQPTDPLTFGAVTVVLSLAALLATFIPARKAIQIEPVVALRNE
jgi:putative ABC transport system permease protein